MITNWTKSCDLCGEPVIASHYSDRYLNELPDYPNHSMCMVKNEIWEKISPGTKKGVFCFDCMEKLLGRKIKYQDLYLTPIGSVPPGNYPWLYTFWKSGEISSRDIIRDLEKSKSPQAFREIEFYKNNKGKE